MPGDREDVSINSARPPATRAVAQVAARASGDPVDPTLHVTLSFHPDRRAEGLLMLPSLAAHGRYRSQFETGTRNGGLTAFPAVEAQVHGPVILADDVEAVVLDACYRDTAVEEAARELPCPVEWHPGFRLSIDELRRHSDYRGPECVEIGAAPARRGDLDPAVIGSAADSGRYDDDALKRVWHCLARFGAPR